MKIAERIAVFVLVTVFLFTGLALADTKGDGIMKEAILSTYYPGNDGTSVMNMKLFNHRGDVRRRSFTILRIDSQKGGNQKYFIYFHTPGDVKGMAYLVYKYLEKNDDRWLYIPAVHMVKRIAAEDGKSSFVGSDFSYEDVSGRSFSQDEHIYLRTEMIGEVQTDVVKNVAKTPENSGFTYRFTWVGQKTKLILKEEYYNKDDRLLKIFTVGKVKNINGFPTTMHREMFNMDTKHKTIVSLSQVKYNVGLKEKFFSQRSLRRPLQKWIKK